MLDLNSIRRRAEARTAPAKLATVANAANVANADAPTGSAAVSQLATVASKASGKRTCAACRHRAPAGTCSEPVAAGLLPRFELVWPDPGYATRCAAWRRNPYEAITKVLLVAARELWTKAETDAWLRDADEDPAAVLDVLVGRGRP